MFLFKCRKEHVWVQQGMYARGKSFNFFISLIPVQLKYSFYFDGITLIQAESLI